MTSFFFTIRVTVSAETTRPIAPVVQTAEKMLPPLLAALAYFANVAALAYFACVFRLYNRADLARAKTACNDNAGKATVRGALRRRRNRMHEEERTPFRNYTAHDRDLYGRDGKPRPTDVSQNQSMGCWYLVLFQALAEKDPERIKRLIQPAPARRSDEEGGSPSSYYRVGPFHDVVSLPEKPTTLTVEIHKNKLEKDVGLEWVRVLSQGFEQAQKEFYGSQVEAGVGFGMGVAALFLFGSRELPRVAHWRRGVGTKGVLGSWVVGRGKSSDKFWFEAREMRLVRCWDILMSGEMGEKKLKLNFFSWKSWMVFLYWRVLEVAQWIHNMKIDPAAKNIDPRYKEEKFSEKVHKQGPEMRFGIERRRSKEDLWHVLRSNLTRGSRTAIGSASFRGDGKNHAPQAEGGLAAHHSYTIHYVATRFPGERWVQLQNPWHYDPSKFGGREPPGYCALGCVRSADQRISLSGTTEEGESDSEDADSDAERDDVAILRGNIDIEQFTADETAVKNRKNNNGLMWMTFDEFAAEFDIVELFRMEGL